MIKRRLPRDKVLANNHGLSLVELVIVLALLSTVLAVGYMFFGFGTRTFNVGEAQSNLQQKVRLSSDFITRELRYAFEVQILDADFPIPESISDDFQYIFVNEHNALEHKTKDGSTTLLGEGTSGANINSLLFIISDDSILRYSLDASAVREPARTYSIDSEIYIDNLLLSNNLIKDIGGSTGVAVRYIDDPAAPPSLLALPKILEAGASYIAEPLNLNLFLSFAEFNLGGLGPTDFVITQNVSGSLSISSATRVDASTATLTITGIVQSYEEPANEITVRVVKEAITINDDNLTATINIIPSAP